MVKKDVIKYKNLMIKGHKSRDINLRDINLEIYLKISEDNIEIFCEFFLLFIALQ